MKDEIIHVTGGRLVFTVLVVVLTGALTLEACGGGASGVQVQHQDPEEVYAVFADCLRGRGANVGKPVLLPDGSLEIPPGEEEALTPRDELLAAAADCQPILSARGLASPGPITLDDEALAQIRQQSFDFARCLRQEGVPWPDPEWEGGAIKNWQSGQLDGLLDDPTVQDSGAACAERTGFDPGLAHAIRDDG